MAQPSNESKSLASLHRYFITCDLMKGHAEMYMESHPAEELVPGSSGYPQFFAYLSLWYATLFVTLDGWRQTGLRDDEVDEVLDHPRMLLLRDFRNVVFHFRPDYVESRTRALIADDGSVEWIRRAHSAIARALLFEMRRRV